MSTGPAPSPDPRSQGSDTPLLPAAYTLRRKGTSEEIAEFEVQFPARCRLAERVDPVEAVGEVEAEGAGRGDHIDPNHRPAEQRGRVPDDGPGREVPGDVEGIDI